MTHVFTWNESAEAGAGSRTGSASPGAGSPPGRRLEADWIRPAGPDQTTSGERLPQHRDAFRHRRVRGLLAFHFERDVAGVVRSEENLRDSPVVQVKRVPFAAAV